MRRLNMTLAALSLLACSSESKLPALIDPDGNGKPNKPGAQTTGSNTGSNTGSKGGTSTGNVDPSGQPEIARSTRSSLQWKRHAALEADLAQALELNADEVCKEFGTASCIRSVHLSPLGGHNPFTTGLLESSSEPLVTTSTVVERVVLSACIARREKDRALGASAVVYAGLDLEAPAPAPEADSTRALIDGLYKRFLARAAEPTELDTLAQLTRDEAGAQVSASDFAASVCLAIGSGSEFLFF